MSLQCEAPLRDPTNDIFEMTKRIVALIIFVVSINTMVQSQGDSALVTFRHNKLYVIANDTNHKLIIFLHGGVSNPYFKQASDKITLNYLFESNDEFQRQTSKNNFDVVLPITNDSINWLDHPQWVFSFLKEYIASASKNYNEIFITGFSDGGTGSYKIFYDNPGYFNGLVVFNGYPQHANYNKNTVYSTVTDKKILFFATYKDKTIPYEFLLTEYCKQKEVNANTYFYLAEGNHSFQNYKEKDIREVFEILNGTINNRETIPIQGYVRNDQLVTPYPFRKKIVRKYHYGKDIYDANRLQFEMQKE